MTRRPQRSPDALNLSLEFNLNIALRLTAAGQDFILLNEGQRPGCIADFTVQQTRTAGTAVSFPTLVLHDDAVRFQRGQQRVVGAFTLQLRTGSTQSNN